MAVRAAAFHQAALRHARFYAQQVSAARQSYQSGQMTLGLSLFDEHWLQINAAFDWLTQHLHLPDAVALAHDLICDSIELLTARRPALEQIRWLNTGLETARQLDDQPGEIDFLTRLGQAHLVSKSLDASAQFFETALTLARSTGDAKGEADALVGLGRLNSLTPHSADAARNYLLAAVELYRFLDDQRGLGWGLQNLGTVEDRYGDSLRAEAYIREALATYERIGDQRGRALASRRLGSILDYRGDSEQALTYLQRVLEIGIAIDDMEIIPGSLLTMGLLKDTQGDSIAARHMLEDALSYSYKSGNKLNMAVALINLGWVAWKLHEYEASLMYHQQSVDVYRSLNHAYRVASGLCNVGFMHMYLHQHNEAAKNLYEGLTITREIGVLNDWLDLLLGFAWLDLRQGHPERCAQIVGMVRANPPQNMYPEREDYLKMVQPELDAALTPDVLATAMSAGSTLDVEAVINQMLHQYAAYAARPSTG